MAPNTTIGSASPVSIGSDGKVEEQSETMTKKVTNDAVSYIRGLAEQRGRNADWAERAVREAANLSATEAKAQGVVEIIATDLDDLLRQANGRTVTLDAAAAAIQTEGAPTRLVEPNLAEEFLQLISDPTVAYLLLSLGLLGIYLELSNPGSLLPGIAGAILLLVALFALGSLPVNWAGALLMILAFALFAVDLFAPTHGVLTLGGLVAFVLGSLLLINTEGNPAFEILPGAIAAVALSLAGFSLFISTVVIRDRHRRPVTGREGMLGAVGAARSALTPDGTVFVEGERWRATSRSGPVEAGRPVRVVAVNGLDLVVEAVAEDSARKE
jgi:membrane-bound serine protease (ClpP class)